MSKDKQRSAATETDIRDLSFEERIARRSKQRERESGGSCLNFSGDKFEIEKGALNIDLIPYLVTVDDNPFAHKGKPWYERTYWVHIIGDTWYMCPKTFGSEEKCPLCQHMQKLRRDPNAQDEEWKPFKAKQRQLFNVLTEDDEVQLWDISYHNFGKLLEAELDAEVSNRTFPFLRGGKTLKVRFATKNIAGQGFLQAEKIEFVDRDDLDKKVLNKAIDLDDILVHNSYEELKAVLEEAPPVEGDEPEKGEEERPSGRRRRSDSAEDEAEGERPAGKTSRRRAPVDEGEVNEPAAGGVDDDQW